MNYNYYYNSSDYSNFLWQLQHSTYYNSVRFISLALLVLGIVCWWRILTKAGEEGWKCLIPFYNFYMECKIAEYTTLFWWALFGGIGTVVAGVVIGLMARSSQALAAIISILPLVYFIALLVMNIKWCIRLARVFGKSGAFAAGLFFLPIIFYAILAFGDAQYMNGSAPAPRPGEVRAWRCPSCGAYTPVSRSACEQCGAARPDKDMVE
ncbi:MAG: hypothetical protein IKP40_12540 [Clostridia bacterium]|nr:hypothetical protein [Clostridia bacterium]